jgi:hypothetical protein
MEHEAMTTVIPLASRRAAPPTPPAEPLATIQLHAQAHNALSSAIYYLTQPECTPVQLQAATARAVRAATLLKRASADASLAPATNRKEG